LTQRLKDSRFGIVHHTRQRSNPSDLRRQRFINSSPLRDMLKRGKPLQETHVSDIQGQAVVSQQAHVALCFGVASKMLECGEKLVRLNLEAVKATFSDWYEGMHDALTKSDEAEASILKNALSLPPAEKVTTYERQIAEIASTTQTQLAEIVDAHYQQSSRQAQWFIEEIAQYAPAHAEAAVALLKQIYELADTAHNSMHNAAKQTASMAQISERAVAETKSTMNESGDEVVEEVSKAGGH
jgi:phasin family protein